MHSLFFRRIKRSPCLNCPFLGVYAKVFHSTPCNFLKTGSAVKDFPIYTRRAWSAAEDFSIYTRAAEKIMRFWGQKKLIHGPPGSAVKDFLIYTQRAWSAAKNISIYTRATEESEYCVLCVTFLLLM